MIASDETGKYSDIIGLTYQKSTKHKHMCMLDRGAQFAPFAALTGYGDEIDESARLTEQSIDLDEDIRIQLDRQMEIITEMLSKGEDTVASIRWFKADTLKEGGAYITTLGAIKKIDTDYRRIEMKDGNSINIDDIISIILTKN